MIGLKGRQEAGGFVEKSGSDMHSVWQLKDRRDVRVRDDP